MAFIHPPMPPNDAVPPIPPLLLILERVHLEIQDTIVHVGRHALRNGHHDLHGQKALRLDLEANLDRVLERAAEQRDVGSGVAARSAISYPARKGKGTSLPERYLLGTLKRVHHLAGVGVVKLESGCEQLEPRTHNKKTYLDSAKVAFGVDREATVAPASALWVGGHRTQRDARARWWEVDERVAEPLGLCGCQRQVTTWSHLPS